MSHVPDNEIEHLALGQLATADSIRVQRHLFKCAQCLHRLIETTFDLAERGIVPGVSLAVDKHKPLFVVHDTADGFIYSRTEKQGRKWIAKHWGDQLQGARECSTMREANEHLLKAFNEMFPEHRCTDRCRVNPTGAAS